MVVLSFEAIAYTSGASVPGRRADYPKKPQPFGLRAAGPQLYSRTQVSEPMTPSAVRPLAFWKLRTALWVLSP